MPAQNVIQKSDKFEIQTFKTPKDVKSLMKTHVPFSGAPQKHPYDPEKIILFIDPYSTCRFYYEFYRNDIGYAEELSNIVDASGETVKMARLWVKKRSIGVRSTPFVVEEILKF